MNTRLPAFARNLVELTLAITGLATSLIGAEPAALRLAIGPFFAPAPDDQLRQVAARLPDLLMVELSHQDRFQLVERDQVIAIWRELNLKASGLTTPQAVSDLGRVLACDWLVTGALVPMVTHTQVWTKIIDMKTSVVLDLQGLPFDVNNLPAALTNIAGFLAHVGAQPHAQRFLTLGRFTDLSNSSGREDWSRRVAALIEQDCRANGVGLVEREAVGPIFEEFQFDQVNLTGSPTPRVKLQSAFWIVDGACSWVRAPDDQVNVALRIQRVGGEQQSLTMTKHPGPELESAVHGAIRGILAETNATNLPSMGLAEARLHTARGMVSAENNDAFSPSRHFASSLSWTNADRIKHFQDNRRAALDSFEKALVLDPKDIRAKLMLGDGLLGDEDPAQRERGKELLREVAASDDATAAKHANFLLSNADKYLPRSNPHQ